MRSKALSSSGSSALTADHYMSYRLLAPFYDWLAPNVSRYRSPQLMAAKVLELAPSPCELLDVGVGTGLSVSAYVTLPRFTRIVGLDPSTPMLDRCRRKFPTVQLHQGTLEEVKGNLGPGFDIIQSCGAVEHIRDLAGFVRHVSSLLRPAGYFVFTYEPELPLSIRQSKRAPHIGTLGRAPVFRRAPHNVHAVLTNARLRADEDIEFTAYLGLVHHLVIAHPLLT